MAGLPLRKVIQSLISTHTDKDGIFPNLLQFFDLETMIDYDGAQGKLGILIHKETEQKVICKIPKFPGFVLRHEHSVMQHLTGSRKFIPSFCEEYGLLRTLISFDSDNPFKPGDGATLLSDVLLMEYIPDSITLGEKAYAKNIYTLLQQTLLALEVGRTRYGLTHYDLHGDNVLIQRCKRDLICLYNINNRKFILPTFGAIPVLIDFGFAYVKGRKDFPLYSPMNHTDAGYLACLSDPYYDARILMVNLSYNMAETKDPREVGFRNKIMGLYSHFAVHPTNGWDTQGDNYSAAEMVIFTIYELEGSKSNSVFYSDGYHAVTILQSLIQLPLRNNKNGDFRPYYLEFRQQFKLFEETVKSNYNKLLILSQLVESARKVRDTFQKEPEEAVKIFRRDFSHYIIKSLQFYVLPPEVDYVQLLTAMYKMADCIETIYYRVMKDLLEKKKEQYKHPTSNLEIYDLIDRYYPTNYELTPTSSVVVWDVDREKSVKYGELPIAFCETFNKTPLRQRAELLWGELHKMVTV